MRAILLFLPLVFACGKDDTDTSETDTDTDSDADTDSDTDADPLVDPDWDFLQGLSDLEACQSYTDSDGVVHTDVEGATAYYRGNLGLYEDGSVEGYEYWVLLPNAAWTSASGAEDCAIVWHVTGTSEEGSDVCGDCELTFDLSATLDESRTDCLDAFVDANYDDIADFDEGYALDDSGAGQVMWYFAASGNAFTMGSRAGAVFSYTTAAECDWF